MHEWALAEAVVAAASEIAEKEELKEITLVRIKIGELQQVDQEILKFAFSQLKARNLEKAEFIIETEKAKLRCRFCGNNWSFQEEKLDETASEAIHFVPEMAHTYIKCPKCGSPDFEILEGRGVWLQSVKGVRQT